MKTTHNGIEITYDENRNVWTFELRGRERSAVSLVAAKAAIDAPPPKEKKPFQRIEAWVLYQYGSAEPQRVTITSIAEGPSWRTGHEVWITDNKKARQKVSASSVYPVGEHNDARVSEYIDLGLRIEQLQEEREKVHAKLTAYRVPSEKP